MNFPKLFKDVAVSQLVVHTINTTYHNNTIMTDTIPKEQKALITGKDLKPVVATIPVIEPSDDQLLVKTKAYALNPTDWKHLRYINKEENVIIGCDASGVIAKVGKNVKGFHVGDNVSFVVHGTYKPIPYPGAFAEYALANPLTTYKYNYDLKLSTEDKIPYGVIDTYEAAASLTVSILTVGISFYNALELKKGRDYSNESILIWSGATATGLIAIQIAKWLGFKNIIATASKNRFEYLKSLGATALYDYKDPDVVSAIRKDFGDDLVYGFDTFSTKETYSNIYQTLSNSKPVFLDNLLTLNEKDLTVPLKTNKVKFSGSLGYLALGEDMVFKGVAVKAAESALKHAEFLHDVQPFLNEKKLKHIPLTVLPNGLEGLIKGLEILESGKYAAEKFVARL